VIQDELHLIEGPLGSMFGLYETAVEGVITEMGGRPKYIASTATISDAEPQINRLFARKVFQFPPHGLDINDSFFIKNPEWTEGWNEKIPEESIWGYTPLVWARLPQSYGYGPGF